MSPIKDPVVLVDEPFKPDTEAWRKASEEPEVPTKWDESQAGQWCWWKHDGEEAHRGRQGTFESLCHRFIGGASYVAPASVDGTIDKSKWCLTCRALYRLPDHGSDVVRLERLLAEAREVAREACQEKGLRQTKMVQELVDQRDQARASQAAMHRQLQTGERKVHQELREARRHELVALEGEARMRGHLAALSKSVDAYLAAVERYNRASGEARGLTELEVERLLCSLEVVGAAARVLLDGKASKP